MHKHREKSMLRAPIRKRLWGDVREYSITRHYSEAKTTVPASISKNTPIGGYYYNIHHLCKLFQIMDGKIRLELDSKGTMMIKSRNEVYVQASQRAPVKKHSSNQTVKEAA